MAEQVGVVKCACGRVARLGMSRSPADPGRRFFHCPLPEVEGGCGWHQWVDEHICTRGKELIPYLFHRVEELEMQVDVGQHLTHANGVLEAQVDALIQEKDSLRMKRDAIAAELGRAKEDIGRLHWMTHLVGSVATVGASFLAHVVTEELARVGWLWQ